MIRNSRLERTDRRSTWGCHAASLSRCFACVGNAADPHTWKLPHLDASGVVEERRIPKAIQAVLTNYRGVKVGAYANRRFPMCCRNSPRLPSVSADCRVKAASLLRRYMSNSPRR